jgi:hypothetical protein
VLPDDRQRWVTGDQLPADLIEQSAGVALLVVEKTDLSANEIGTTVGQRPFHNTGRSHRTEDLYRCHGFKCRSSIRLVPGLSTKRPIVTFGSVAQSGSRKDCNNEVIHMSEKNEPRSGALRAAAEKRIELKQALSMVEIAAASPSGESGWRDALRRALEALQVALVEHVEEVEGDDGLLAELMATEPRLANRIGQLQDEHPKLCSQVAASLKAVTSVSDVDDLRDEVLDSLTAIVRHRQKGADLVYEGYSVDIGGS